jgi:hypothetical protein
VNCLDENSVVSFAKVALSSITSFENLMVDVFKSANPFSIDTEKYWTIFAPPLVQSLRILENSHVLGKGGGLYVNQEQFARMVVSLVWRVRERVL